MQIFSSKTKRFNMKRIFQLTASFLLCVSLSQCSNQRQGAGKFRLHNMLVPKETFLNLKHDQRIYFSVEIENRKVGKEQIWLGGYIHTKGSSTVEPTTLIPVESLDSVVKENKVFGIYYVKQNTVDLIRKMEADGKLAGIRHLILKPIVKEGQEAYIAYQLLVGLPESEYSISSEQSHYSAKGIDKYEINNLVIVETMDPRPPAPPGE